MILMNDFQKEPDELRRYMLAASQRVIDSGWYVLGSEGAKFEKIWAAQCDCSFGVGVGNGMDAIEIILRSLHIGSGDEVITTAMTAFATTLAIYRAGATPVLADIDSETGLLAYESVSRCITKNTKAIILVHLYGQMRGMSQWVDFAKNNNIFLIEDCAQAHLASVNGRKAGSYGIAGAFSFYPTKNLGALGDGGMIVTNDHAINELSLQLRNYGQSIRYHHPHLGLNSRLDEMQAAILVERNRFLEQFTGRRREIAKQYSDHISNERITLLAPPVEEDAHVFHLYAIKTNNRERLIKHLLDKEIQSLIHYPIPIHLQSPFVNILRDPNGLQSSEEHAKVCLSIPCHPQMTEDEVYRVIEAVNEFK